MPEPFSVLLDQNIPQAIGVWLRQLRPSWIIRHTADVGLSGKSDETIFAWAQQQQTFIITFDEDFADRRSFLIGTHCGIARLRVWPTTLEETKHALERLLTEVSEDELSGALIAAGQHK